MKKTARDITLTVLILVAAFFICVVFQNVFGINEHVSTLFAFAVFIISLVTDGYIYGMTSAFIGTLAINFAFTFPFFAFDFITPVNLISAIVMFTIAFLTGTLTTQIKRQEALKAESDKERMRANLLRAVSHDIRTPLTTIYGSASTLYENDSELSGEQRRQMLMGIKEDADWLVRIVENLLSVTKLDGEHVKLIKTPTVLDELIDSVMSKFKKRYPEQAVSVELPNELIVIPMDALLIEQVVINLLDNAVRHAVGMDRLTLTVTREGNNARFEITDNGKGIPEERIDRLFEGFYGLTEDSADSQKKNAGIGLSVCASIIKAHGGSITAENLAEGGARFGFSLILEEQDYEQ